MSQRTRLQIHHTHFLLGKNKIKKELWEIITAGDTWLCCPLLQIDETLLLGNPQTKTFNDSSKKKKKLNQTRFFFSAFEIELKWYCQSSVLIMMY